MKKNILLFLFLSTATFTFSQEPLHCGADELRIATLKANPKIAQAVIKRDSLLEAFTKSYVEQFYRQRTPSPATYVIPVVFHVIHNYGPENISAAQILDAISVLNQTFRKQRADTSSIVAAFKPLHADCEIEFRLATLDPNGNCTSGINRIASSLTSIGDHSVKSLIHWPPDKYLNIYVVQNAAGLAGHCVWPADADSIPLWDGIVIAHNYVGTIGTSNSTTAVALAHECGHYLNLQHIWGGNNVPGFYYYPCADTAKDCAIDDLVADTPPTIGWLSCNLSGHSCGNVVDNVQNAMDYSYCNKMFTYGQKARMHACLNDTIAHRNNLWQTANLIATGTYSPPGALCNADFTSNKTVVCEVGSNTVFFTNTSYNGTFTSLTWTFPGGSPATSAAASPTIAYSLPGNYPVTLKVRNGSDSATITKTGYITVLPDTGSPYPFTEGYESTTALNGPQWFSNSFDAQNAWSLTTAAACSGTHSVMLDNFSNTMDTKDELISPIINLSGGSGIAFKFKYAFARKDTISQDQLQVYVTKDCNSTWIQRLNLAGAALQTVPPQAVPYVPSGSGDWQQASVSIPVSYYTPNFRFKFVFASRGGNNVYIDDINIDVASGLDEITSQVSNLSVYPNPANDVLNLSFNLPGPKQLSVIVTGILGKEVYNTGKMFCVQGENVRSVDLKELKSGFYFVKISDGKQEITRKFVVSR
jgi:PKD repeat protein